MRAIVKLISILSENFYLTISIKLYTNHTFLVSLMVDILSIVFLEADNHFEN